MAKTVGCQSLAGLDSLHRRVVDKRGLAFNKLTRAAVALLSALSSPSSLFHAIVAVCFDYRYA